MACCIFCQRPTGGTPAPEIADAASRLCVSCQEHLFRLIRELVRQPDHLEVSRG